MSFQRLLVPVEFAPPGDVEIAVERSVKVGPNAFLSISEHTQRTLAFASALVGEGHLRLVHAAPVLGQLAAYVSPETPYFSPELHQQLTQSAVEQSVAALKHLASHLKSQAKIDVTARSGIAETIILEEAKDFNADGIVMPASARGRVARALVGSTVDKIVRQASCAVVVLPIGVG